MSFYIGFKQFTKNDSAYVETKYFYLLLSKFENISAAQKSINYIDTLAKNIWLNTIVMKLNKMLLAWDMILCEFIFSLVKSMELGKT